MKNKNSLYILNMSTSSKKSSSSSPAATPSGLISVESVRLLNYRVREEETSSRIYLAMSLWLENNAFLGAAKLWRKYSDEEMTHAQWARKYLLSLGVTPEVSSLDAIRTEYKDLPEIIEESYKHEIEITNQLKVLASHALVSGDHMLYTLAQKYLAEQVEEHDKTIRWIDELHSFGTSPTSLKLLDNTMGAA